MTFLAHQPGGAATGPRQWWERRWFVAVLVLISAVPLLYPEVPPLVDLLGHMGRYRIQLDLVQSPWLGRYYEFDWAVIGNLGVDLLVIPLRPLFGLELAVKLIVLAIPPLTVAGFLWVAREVHHRLPSTALFALPFAFSFPFHFGFANFTLAMALAMLAFGLWLHLGERNRERLRAILFVPISIVIFFTHAFGWGTLGLLCFSAEAVRQHDRGAAWFAAGMRAALHASVMLVPVLFMAMWRSGAATQRTFGWFNWELKWQWVYSALRDRWEIFDIGTVALLGMAFLFAIFHRRLVISRNLALSALVLATAFILLPWTIFGSAYADMRIVPYTMAIALLAIRFKGTTDLPLAHKLAVIALSLFLVRVAGTTASLAIAANDQAEKLRALNHVPMGAAVVNLTGERCDERWGLPRDSHLGAMAIVRRHAFSNDQWAIDGANLLKVRFREAGPFMADSSQMVRSRNCRKNLRTIDQALAAIPDGVFDYVWLIDTPAHDPTLSEGWIPVWRGKDSVLYATSPGAAVAARREKGS
jgi:hypothetical protein